MKVSFPQKIWFLQQIDIFRGIPEQDYAVIDRNSSERRYRRGDTIYRPGSAATSVFMIKRGKVKLSRLTEDGKEIIYAILKEGDLFGEIPAAPQHEEEAVALTDTYVCVMRRQDFEYLLQQKPYLSLRFARWIGIRRHLLENRLQDLLFQSVPVRVSRLLLSLAKDFGQTDPSGNPVIPFHLSHQDTAGLTGTSRETVSALLSNWKRSGLIAYSRKSLTLLDLPALQSIAASR